MINQSISNINQEKQKTDKSYLKISQEDFENNINRLIIYPNKAKFLVGVSGGSDSLCLAIMLNIFANKIGAELKAVIVDHKLRLESTEEAIFVSQLLDSLKIKNIILNRHKVTITSCIQSKARDDRYSLLKSYARENGYPYIFIAHHLDDQLETIAMREEAGENIVGSSGMSTKIISSDAIIIRPFMPYTKQQIINTLKDFTNTWVEDPSNKNTKYTRVKHRIKLNSIDEKSKKILIDKYYKNVDNRIELENSVLESLSRCILINSLGLIKLNLILFDQYEEKIKILVLRKLIKFADSRNYEVKIEKIKNFIAKLKVESSFKFSLGSCLLKVKKEELTIYKNRVVQKSFEITNWWDFRFLFCNKNNVSNFFISNITKKIYFEKTKEKPFKKYLESKGIDGDFIWGLPWVFSKNGSFDWDYKNYDSFKYKSKSSLLMNFFSE